jgi:ATP-binding cassette, subfamily B, multidrug efflux pump
MSAPPRGKAAPAQEARSPQSGPPPGPGGHLAMPVRKAKDFGGSGRRLLALLKPHRPAILAVVGLGAVSVAFNIMGPKLLGRATTLIFEGIVAKQLPAGMSQAQAVAMLQARGQGQIAQMVSGMHLTPGTGVDLAALARVAIWLAVVYLLSTLFNWGQQHLTVGVSQRTVYTLRDQVSRKLGRLPISFFDGHQRGDVLSRVTNDIDNVANSIQQSLSQIITSFLTIIGVLAMMCSINLLLAGLSLLTVPLSMGATIAIAKRSQKQFALQWQRTGVLNAHVEEMHTGRTIVKLFGREEASAVAFDEKNLALYDAGFKAQFMSGIIQPVMMFINNLNYVAIAVIGGVRVASGRLSLGDVQAFIQYSRQFGWPIIQVASIMNVMQSAVASAERVFELLDEPEESSEAVETVPAPSGEGHIELRGVSFRYAADTPLIDDLDLDVKSGQTIAIVGPTGAGKTTLVNLLLRFYDIDKGRIAIDGVDIRTMPRDRLRSLFSMVQQEAWLFSGSIRENIAYGREGATTEQIEAAARAAYVDHFVRTLPDGYDTVLDDEAASVSQGERQLLTIARAFLADKPILILDEATSSVDTRTERLIQQAMSKLRKNRTSFVIAHRLSTIRDADVILVMNHGRLVEQGTHHDLLAARGFYHELYQSQFASAAEGAA